MATKKKTETKAKADSSRRANYRNLNRGEIDGTLISMKNRKVSGDRVVTDIVILSRWRDQDKDEEKDKGNYEFFQFTSFNEFHQRLNIPKGTQVHVSYQLRMRPSFERNTKCPSCEIAFPIQQYKQPQMLLNSITVKRPLSEFLADTEEEPVENKNG